MFIIFGGLPGSGKSTLARHLARNIQAVHLRIDTIEQAMRRSEMTISGPEGYLVACALAEDHLNNGHTVIADSVNPIEITRQYWRDVAQRAGKPSVEIEILCSDAAEHRQRVETRKVDIVDLKLPTWQQVLDRHYEPWPEAMSVDTAGLSLEESLSALKQCVDLTRQT